MLKVAHILPWADHGGTERSVKNLYQFSQKTEPYTGGFSFDILPTLKRGDSGILKSRWQLPV